MEPPNDGYREYDVQDLIIQRHNIRFLRFRIRHSGGKNNSREVTSENTLDITDPPSGHLLSINIISVECPRI